MIQKPEDTAVLINLYMHKYHGKQVVHLCTGYIWFVSVCDSVPDCVTDNLFNCLRACACVCVCVCVRGIWCVCVCVCV